MQALAARKSRRAERRLWTAARTIEDLGELTAQWLEGRISYLPGYYGTPAEETQPLLGHLAGYNRHGFATTSSQPGITPTNGSGQRAWVEGFCTPDAARAIHAATLHTDLVLITALGADDNFARIAVTTKDHDDLTWAGATTSEYIDDYYGRDCPHALDMLHNAWQIAVIDPVWGRNTLLWDLLATALDAH